MGDHETFDRDCSAPLAEFACNMTQQDSFDKGMRWHGNFLAYCNVS
jgi:hypothetical protein